jgi:hypothetical protein
MMALDRPEYSIQKGRVIKATSILVIARCRRNERRLREQSSRRYEAESTAAQRDYELLSGTWQLTRGVMNGKPVPANDARNTIRIRDPNKWTQSQKAARMPVT